MWILCICITRKGILSFIDIYTAMLSTNIKICLMSRDSKTGVSINDVLHSMFIKLYWKYLRKIQELLPKNKTSEIEYQIYVCINLKFEKESHFRSTPIIWIFFVLTLKALVYSATHSNEDTLQQGTFMPLKPFATKCDSHSNIHKIAIQVERILRIFCELRSDKH